MNDANGTWMEKKLKDVIFPVSDTFNFTNKPNVHFLNTGDIFEGKLLHNNLTNISNLPGQAKKSFKIGDILFSEIRPENKRYMLVNFDSSLSVASTKLMVLRTKENVDVNYIYQFLTFEKTLREFQLIAESRSGTFPQITFDSISKYIINIPDLSVQKKISTFLDLLDMKVSILEKQNTAFEELSNALFNKLFIIEANPQWKSGVLADIAENVKNGVKFNEIPADAKYVGLEHIDRKKITLDKHASPIGIKSNKFQFKENDILFGKLRPYFHKVCLAPFSGVCSTDILVIRPKKNLFFSYCLFAFYQKDLIDYVDISSGGTRMPRTDWKTLGNYPILIPPDDLLDNFNKEIQQFVYKMKQNQIQRSTLLELKSKLLPKLMNGEIKLN